MCEICTHTPCHPRCPNAPDPQPVYECAWCKDPIVAGSEYYKIDEDYYHEECLADNALSVLVDKIDVSYGTAEERSYEYDCC